MMGTLAFGLVDRFLTSSLSSSFFTRSTKKWLSLLMKLGQTQIKSISLVFDRKSRTQLPNGSNFAVQLSSWPSLILIQVLAISRLQFSMTAFKNFMVSSFMIFCVAFSKKSFSLSTSSINLVSKSLPSALMSKVSPLRSFFSISSGGRTHFFRMQFMISASGCRVVGRGSSMLFISNSILRIQYQTY